MGTYLQLPHRLPTSRERRFSEVLELQVGALRPNPLPPRTDFSTQELRALAESIAQNGVLQPLLVRKTGDCYEVIAGERRLRAAQLAGLSAVPCLVYQMNERAAAVTALVDNLQREKLGFFDEAAAIRRLIELYGLTQQDVAHKLGRAQGTIANKLRLLGLSQEHRDLILKHGLSERHARALLKLPLDSERQTVLEHVIRHALNVDKTEQYIADFTLKSQERASIQRRAKVFRNVGIFVNTINKAVETMNAAGIDANSAKIQHDDYVEYHIRIPYS